MADMITRFGASVPADEVFLAWTSGDLQRMLAAISLQTNPVDRHHLLHCTVQALYRQRTDRGKRELFLQVARLHLEEMQSLIDGLRRDDLARKERSQRLAEEESRRTGVPAPRIEAVPGGGIPFIETFLLIVRVLCEDERYQEAKKVWHRAGEVGYLSCEALAQEEVAVERRQRRNEARSKRGGSIRR